MQWKIRYIAKPSDKSQDQILTDITIPKDNIPQGETLNFNLVSNGPNLSIISDTRDIFDTTAIMLEAFYRNECFWRVSYIVYHGYDYEIKDGQFPQNHSQVDWAH